MTNNDLLRLILVSADDVGRVFDYTEITTWPPGAIDEFRRLGLIRQAANGLNAPCPNCADGHIESVTIRAGPGDTKRFYIWCPESMRVEITPEMCVGWEIDPNGLAAAVAGALGLKGAPKPVVADRFWRLGRTPWPPGSGHTREVVFVRRMHDDDASSLADRIGLDGGTIVLVPHLHPHRAIWSGKVPPVIGLSEIIGWDDGQLVPDVEVLVDAVQAVDATPYTIGGLTMSTTELKAMIRRQIKADKKSELTDDAMVAAYKIHGTSRAAAEALREAGYEVHHSTIARKVQKAEEADELACSEDSASVSRTVASQPRDRAKKFLERR